MRAVFLHPDLGIGGAERLIIDAGLALKLKGYDVNFITNHHDKNHCFTETRDGTMPVATIGDWLPRNIFGYCYALCAYIRMLYLTLYVLLFVLPKISPDVVICDQIPIGIPFLKLFGHKVLFYCHFPDLLLSKPGGKMKSLYRVPIDWVEEVSINFADDIMVNSMFTMHMFSSTFQRIERKPNIIYPSINTNNIDEVSKRINMDKILTELPRDTIVFLSINRYERKKNLELAIRSLQSLETILSDAQYSRVHLVMMGGYDDRVIENIEYFNELQELCEEQRLTSKVTFLRSPPEEEKIGALRFCTCLLYTPANEHFGIVPIEAMYTGKAVIAVNSGGPTETIQHEKTGFLTDPVPEYFAHYMAKLVNDENYAKKIGAEGRKRFDTAFSFTSFGNKLDKVIKSVLAQRS